MSATIIGVDFDGTIVEHEYPRIGAPVPLAIETLRDLSERGSRLVLFTMRSGIRLDEAVAWIQGHGVDLWGINTNPEQREWTESPKAYCHIYIDDAAFGCPLIRPERPGARPYVDWREVRKVLIEGGPR